MLKIIESQSLTMTSREIAEMLGKQLGHVHRDIKVMLESLGLPQSNPIVDDIDLYGFFTIHDDFGRIDTIHLNKDLTYCLITGYNAKARLQIVKRWQFLESQQSPSLPNFADPVAAARAWADAVEQKQLAEQQLSLAAPKVEFVDKYVTASGNIGFRQMAKLLKAKEPELRGFLISNRIMYRLSGSLTPYQNHIDAGRFEVKAGVADHGENNHAYTQAKLTPKGVEWLAGEWAKHQARNAVSATKGGAS